MKNVSADFFVNPMVKIFILRRFSEREHQQVPDR
jgi:hypothetical protein